MKKLVFILLITGSLFTVANIANAGDGGSKKKKESSPMYVNRIENIIKNLEIDLKESCLVEINFNTNRDNFIVINEIKTNDPALKKYLFDSLNGKKINGDNFNLVNEVLTLRLVPSDIIDF